MKDLSIFQLAILIIAGLAIVIGVIVFAFSTSRGINQNEQMEIWGTIPEDVMKRAINNLIGEEGEVVNIIYEEIAEEDFDTHFVEKLAEGSGPDIVILPQDLIVRHQNKLLTVSYEFYPERTFKNTFIEEGEIFSHQDGVMGMPFVVDPLIMYWNRTHFSNAGITNPPTTWDEVLAMVPSLSEVDSTFTIFKSGVALGEVENVNNGKEIFMMMVLQAGNPMVIREEAPGVYDKYQVILSSRLGYPRPPVESALTYFAQFSNPSKTVYSWNRSLPASQDRFVSGDLSIYFGFATEEPIIRRRNPNLNFDVALVPASKGGGAETFGKMQALAITKSASNPSEAFRVLSKLTEPLTIDHVSKDLGTPPVRRDLLEEDQSSDSFKTITYQAALRAKGVYEIDPKQTSVIIEDMVESYSSGRARESEAVSRAQAEMNSLLE